MYLCEQAAFVININVVKAFMSKHQQACTADEQHGLYLEGEYLTLIVEEKSISGDNLDRV